MTISHLLEEFASSGVADHQALTAAIEDTHLAAFEKGYQAGWDDSTKAHHAETGRISQELTQKVQDLAFTYHEAFTHFSTSLHSLVETLLRVTLPEGTRNSQNAIILAEISAILAPYETPEVVLAVAADSYASLSGMLKDRVPNLKRIIRDPTLDAGQIILRVSQDEHLIDLQASTERIANLMESFFNQRSELNG